MKSGRRNFLKTGGIAVAGALVLPQLGCMTNPQTQSIGIQLYTLRDELTKNVEEVIREVAKAGYSFVEVFDFQKGKGFWGLTPQELKSLFDKYNLSSPSGHYDFSGWEATQNDDILHAYAEAAKVLKHQYIVVPSINSEFFKSEDLVKAFAKKMNRAAEILKKEGLKLAYHNHDFEFHQLAGKTAYDVFLQETDAKLVDFELDLYWAIRSKQNVLQLFENNKGRFPLWHIKDMDKADTHKNTEIGNGSIDFKPLLKKAELAGLKFPIVEQENFDIPAFESIRKSFQFLQKV